MDKKDLIVTAIQNDNSTGFSNTSTNNMIKTELSSPPLKRMKSSSEDSHQDSTYSEQLIDHNISVINKPSLEMMNMPMKPLTPYMSYRNMVFQEIKHKHPGCSPYDLACVISAKWSLLTDAERKVWELKYEKELNKYNKILKMHHTNCSTNYKTLEDKSLSQRREEIHGLKKFDAIDYCSFCKKLKELRGFSADINGRQIYRGDLCSKICFLEASKQLKCIDKTSGSTHTKFNLSEPVSISLTPFNWAEYLSETNSKPADWMYCRQASYPPSNIFSVGMKLEARRHDQVKDSSHIIFSLATVAFKIGPRLLLHFDGSPSKYDMWTLCDSSDIHPIGWTDHGSLLPPTGYKHDPKTYMQFYSLKIQKGDIATARCFKKVPSMPPKNCFDVGMKLEAVDKQNPSVIGVATVVNVNGDIINIEFDGYPGLGYASHYGDRDFFPVGWCAHAKHPLRIPGDAKSSLSGSRYSPRSSMLINEISMQADKALFLRPESPKQKSLLNSVEVYINAECSCGPYIDVAKLQQLPRLRKGDITPVLKGLLEDIIACAISPKTVFGFLKPGRGNCVITAVCEGVTFQCCLNVIDRVSSFWDVLEQFSDNLRCCPNLFSTTEIHHLCTQCYNKSFNSSSSPLYYQKFTTLPNSHTAFPFKSSESSQFNQFEDGDIQDGHIHSYMNSKKSESFTLKHVDNDQLSSNIQRNTEKKVDSRLSSPIFQVYEVPNLQRSYVDTASQTESFYSSHKFVPPILSSYQPDSLSTLDDVCVVRKLSHDESKEIVPDLSNSMQAGGIDIKNAPSTWTVDDVVLFFKKTCIKEYSQAFKEHEIDGKALLLLQRELVLHHMGFKLGPAVKLLDLIEDLRVAEHSLSKI